MACEARHAPTGPSGRTCALCARTARPPAPPLCVLRVLCDLKTHWQSACASTPLICNKSAQSAVPHTGSPSSCTFVVLRGPSCQPRRANLPLSPNGSTRRALAARSLFSVLRSLFSGAALPPLAPHRSSRKPRSFLVREGWRSLRRALASIWRMRSRVTLNALPTSSRVSATPSVRP